MYEDSSTKSIPNTSVRNDEINWRLLVNILKSSGHASTVHHINNLSLNVDLIAGSSNAGLHDRIQTSLATTSEVEVGNTSLSILEGKFFTNTAVVVEGL